MAVIFEAVKVQFMPLDTRVGKQESKIGSGDLDEAILQVKVCKASLKPRRRNKYGEAGMLQLHSNSRYRCKLRNQNPGKLLLFLDVSI